MSRDLHFERMIAAPPERVYAAFTDPAGQREFYDKDTPGWIVESACELRIGGVWSIAFGPSREQLYRHDHEFLTVEPPRRLVMTTTETRLDGSSFAVTTEFTFAAESAGTRMTMVQSGFPTAELRVEHTIGVPHAFDRLERTLHHDN